MKPKRSQITFLFLVTLGFLIGIIPSSVSSIRTVQILASALSVCILLLALKMKQEEQAYV